MVNIWDDEKSRVYTECLSPGLHQTTTVLFAGYTLQIMFEDEFYEKPLEGWK